MAGSRMGLRTIWIGSLFLSTQDMETIDSQDSPNVQRPCREPRLKHRISRPSSDTPLPRLLYSRDESAYQLSLSVRAIDYMIAQGRIRVRRIGGRILIPHSELLRIARTDQIEPIAPSSRRLRRQRRRFPVQQRHGIRQGALVEVANPNLSMTSTTG